MVLQEAGQVPRGPQVEYVRSKLKLLLYFTNMAAYLMFRAQGVSLTLHPAIGRPVHYRCCSDVRVHYRCTHRVFFLLALPPIFRPSPRSCVNRNLPPF